MKKLYLILVSIFLMANFSFAQETATPKLLNDRASFSDYKKFDAPTIYADIQANVKLIEDYEANFASYQDIELFPVIMSYISTQNFDKAKALLEKHLVAAPDNVAAVRSLGSMVLIEQKYDEAIELYKKAFEAGDLISLKSLASAYLIAKKHNEFQALLGSLKPRAKTDVETANLILIYALAAETKDIALAKEIIANLDYVEALKSANADALNTQLSLYMQNQELWAGDALILPARGMILNSAWLPAMKAYKEVLAANPKNTVALRGKALVDYRTGGLPDAIKGIKTAISLGDTLAFNDLVELAMLANMPTILDEFKKQLEATELNPQPRLMLIQFAEKNNRADLFFLGALGKGNELIYTNEQAKKIVADALKNFATDSRAKEVEALLAK